MTCFWCYKEKNLSCIVSTGKVRKLLFQPEKNKLQFEFIVFKIIK